FASGALVHCRNPDFCDAALGDLGARPDLVAPKQLAVAGGVQCEGGISWPRQDPERTVAGCLETSVDVGNLRAAAILRPSALHPQARADANPVFWLVCAQGRHDLRQPK